MYMHMYMLHVTCYMLHVHAHRYAHDMCMYWDFPLAGCEGGVDRSWDVADFASS